MCLYFGCVFCLLKKVLTEIYKILIHKTANLNTECTVYLFVCVCVCVLCSTQSVCGCGGVCGDDKKIHREHHAE